MVRVELAWLGALAEAGLLKPERVPSSLSPGRLDPVAVEGAGNPVPALIDAIRAQMTDDDVAALLHKGLTSQDVLDTALVLVARDALSAVVSSLDFAADALASLADEHRGTVMSGRTLTQHAVPVTFGLKAAQWLVGVVEATERVDRVRSTLPVQCGGAAGTLALASELV